MRALYEFFCGGGMVRAAMREEWNCLFANDISETKAAAYKVNWGGEHLKVRDIAHIKPSDLPGRADLAWASFPCQDLSLAGNGVGLNGERSGTFWTFWKLMMALKKEGRNPSLIALENVYGTLTSHEGKDFESIAKAIVTGGYRLGAMVIDAARFLPHSRPRLFIVAVDASVALPGHLLANGPSKVWHPSGIVNAFERMPQRLQSQWIWWNLPLPANKPKGLKDIIEDSPKDVQWHSKEETSRLRGMMTPINRLKVEGAIELACQTGERVVGTIYRRMRQGLQRAEARFDGVAGCLRTPSGGSSLQTVIVINKKNVRSRLLSRREAARLMGLDDDYKLPERYSEAYHLTGDGVAVPVVNHLAQHIFNPIIDEIKAFELAGEAA